MFSGLLGVNSLFINASTRVGSLTFLALILAMGCTDDGPDLVCTPGETNMCLGPGACIGAQVCLADGSTYGDCDCGVTDGGVTDGGAGSGSTGGANSTGGVSSIGGGSGTGACSSTAGVSSTDGGTGIGGRSTGEDSDVPDSSTGDSSTGDSSTGDGGDAAPPPQAQDSQCDMNGVWAVRKLSLPEDTVLGNVQPQSTWTYLEITQDGADFTIGKSVDCGHRASGNADVAFSIATMIGISDKNPEAGRSGTCAKNGDNCD